MKIAIDTRNIIPIGHGVARHTQNLIDYLAKIDTEDEFLCLSCPQSAEFKLPGPNFRRVKTNSMLFGFGEQIEVPALLQREKVDVYHTPSISAFVWQPCKTVITIHDLIAFRNPSAGIAAVAQRAYFRYVIGTAARKANKILTVSDQTKADVNHFYGVPFEKIQTVYNGVSLSVFYEEKDDAKLQGVREKYGIQGDFIFNMANAEPHKNVYRLMRAYKILKQKMKNPPKLVPYLRDTIAVKGNETAEKWKKELGLENDVILIYKDIKQQDLVDLYNAATVFCFPSLFEGFGLPPLEAMACGTPVVTSNVSSLPEVVEDAAITIDPSSPEAIADGMFKVLSDKNLAAELIRKGFERPKFFTWEKMAAQTLSVYKSI